MSDPAALTIDSVIDSATVDSGARQSAIAPPVTPIWDYENITIEDDEPVDSLISEKQQRLAVNALYSSYQPGQPFLVAANVGLFYDPLLPPVVPDVMLSLGVEVPEDWQDKKNRSYFVHILGKPPELAVEIVSNDKGNELGKKLTIYAQAGVRYYVVFDPLQWLSSRVLQAFELVGGRYVELAEPWFDEVQLGLTLWEGSFENRTYPWLRWCDLAGQVLPTGDELAFAAQLRAAQAEYRANEERSRADEERSRADEERSRADEERDRADQERQRAEAAERRAAELADRLRALGEIDE